MYGSFVVLLSSNRSLLGKIRPPIPPRSDQPVPEIIGVLRDMPRPKADETRTGDITSARTGDITSARTGDITSARTGDITSARTGDITSARTGVITSVVTPESNTVNPATNNTSTMSTDDVHFGNHEQREAQDSQHE